MEECGKVAQPICLSALLTQVSIKYLSEADDIFKSNINIKIGKVTMANEDKQDKQESAR